MLHEGLKRIRIFDLNFSGFYSASKGFTLIELIIVMVIIGIATGIVGIMIGKGSDGLEIKTFTKEVSSMLRYARNHAVSEKRNYCFVIHKEDGEIRLYADPSKSNDNEESEDIEEKGQHPLISKPLPDNFIVTLDESYEDVQDIEFFPYGNSSGGIIKIDNEKGTVFYINVNRLTGKIEVIKDEY